MNIQPNYEILKSLHLNYLLYLACCYNKDNIKMWTAKIQKLQSNNTQKYILEDQDGKILSFGTVLDLWQFSEDFRTYFISLLKEAPYKAFFWETPAIRKRDLKKPFEFVLVNSLRLPTVQAERRAFSKHFEAASEDIISFMNLGKDARLIVPCPLDDDLDYPHLAAFIRNAPDYQIHDFWKAVGFHMSEHISERYTWLSTAGLGVYWLHIRLDSRPKYYRFGEYKVVD